LAKKRKGTSASRGDKFAPENSPYFALIAFAVIFVAVLVLFSDFVSSDRMLFGSDTLQAGYYFRSYYVDYVHEHGAVPQWNPYIFGGMPYVEAFHGDIFYPLSTPKFFGELKRMLGWNLIIHIFLAGIFMYLTARQFRLSKIAALFSGISYMFAGLLVSWVAPGHDGKIFAATLFPLVILFIDRGFEKRPILNFSLLGVVIGFIILTPHAQMSYFMLWAAALYTLFKMIMLWREGKSLFAVAKPGVFAMYAVVVGLFLSAIQFYPGYIYTTDFSPRADTKSGWEWATSWSLHQEEAFSLLIPEFVGTMTRETNTRYWGKNAFKDNSETIGVTAILLALIGIFFVRRREGYFFAGLALFALLFALGATTPLFHLFYAVIPKVPSLRAPSMIMFLFTFSIALLAGMGVQYVRDRSDGDKPQTSKRFNYLILGFPALMLLFALLFSMAGRGMISAWCSIFYSEASRTMVAQGVSKFDVALSNLPAIQSGAWLAFLFSALAAAAVMLYRRRMAGAWILVGLAAVPLINGVRLNSRFVSTVDPAIIRQRFEPNALTDYFKNQPGQFRIMNFQNYESDDLAFHGLQLPVGYHGNQLRWYDNLLGNIPVEGQQARLLNTSRLNPRFLNLMGNRYIITPSNQALPEGALGPEPLVREAAFGPSAVYRNENAFPRVYLVDQYRVFEDRLDIYEPVLNSSDDLRQIVYLEEEPLLDIQAHTVIGDSAWIVHYGVDSIQVGLNCSSNKILVLTDVYYDAWKVTVDGQPARLLRSYGALRALAVPAGGKEVVFKFDSERYNTGKLVTWLTSLYLVVIIGGCLIAPRLRRKEEVNTEE
jgi:hypothetical protein